MEAEPCEVEAGGAPSGRQFASMICMGNVALPSASWLLAVDAAVLVPGSSTVSATNPDLTC